jgi:hypothetical protein
LHDIIVEKLFSEKSKCLNLEKSDFRKLLQAAVKESYFSFNKKIYYQIDGMSMGNPLGPVFANIFLSHHETSWLENCPADFKPSYYRRYVDDSFLLFQNKEKVRMFTEYLNRQHPNMRFTYEVEIDQKLPFIGMNVLRSEGFSTTIYHKPTSTGLYTKFKSCMPLNYKMGLPLILFHRAYQLCSNYSLMHVEFEKIKNMLWQNGFPKKKLDDLLYRFLFSRRESPKSKEIEQTAEKQKIMVKLPFIGQHSLWMRRQLRFICKRAYPQIDLQVIFTAGERIQSWFQIKDRLPISLASNVVYEFTCRDCKSTYIGMTTRHLGTRIYEHTGISMKTGKRSKNGGNRSSHIDQHIRTSGHQIDHNDFKLIERGESELIVKIKEAIHVLEKKPNLNVQADFDFLVLKR